MLCFSAARSLFNRNSARSRTLFNTMKGRNSAFAPALRMSDENIFNRTDRPVPAELKIYCATTDFEWRRTWSVNDGRKGVGSAPTLLIKGRHYANFPKPLPLAVDAAEDAAPVRRAAPRALGLFLVSFSLSSIAVFLLALFS